MVNEAAALAMDEPAVETTEKEAPSARISWGLPSAAKQDDNVLQQERDKHRKRAERFATTYVEPGKTRKDLVLESKKERLKREGFVTGFDPFSQEELDKRRDRAARFNLQDAAPLPEYKPAADIAAKARRAQKFGVDYEPSSAVLMDMDLFEEKKEVARDVARRMDTIYLYGVDVMSTAEVLHYFADYGPTFVEWINDSSCNVLFGDFSSAKRAMVGSGSPLPPVEGSAAAGLDPTDLQNLPFLWHQGREFVKDGTPIHLVYRIATGEDVKQSDAPKRTRELWKSGARPKGRRGRQEEDAPRRDAGPGQDDDGDVEMRAAKKPRGGRRVRRRQERRDAAGRAVGEGDAEMSDAEAQEDAAGHQQAAPTTGHVDMGPPAYAAVVSAKQPSTDEQPCTTGAEQQPEREVLVDLG